MPKPKKAIVPARRVKAEIPEIYVKISEGWRSSYAQAKIRVKNGKYLYLQWRDGERVHSFYLGQKRNS
jgi:hypothetical protein